VLYMCAKQIVLAFCTTVIFASWSQEKHLLIFHTSKLSTLVQSLRGRLQASVAQIRTHHSEVPRAQCQVHRLQRSEHIVGSCDIIRLEVYWLPAIITSALMADGAVPGLIRMKSSRALDDLPVADCLEGREQRSRNLPGI